MKESRLNVCNLSRSTPIVLQWSHLGSRRHHPAQRIVGIHNQTCFTHLQILTPLSVDGYPLSIAGNVMRPMDE